MKYNSFTFFLLFTFTISAFSQFRSGYPDIPRIDVHSHVADDLTAIANYMDMRSILLDSNKIDLAMWINLGDRNAPIENLETVVSAGQGRMLCAFSDYAAHDGLKYPPAALEGLQKQGFVGYKIWSGPWYRRIEKKEDGYPYIDDPAHEETFAEMERLDLLVASIHIADPNGPWGERTDWLADPIEYWSEINAWRNVLEKHPKLRVVVAHGNWLLCQDAQIDYLRNMLATFPNLHIDLAATFQYYHLVNRDNLRSFMIEWADRILFGTDIGRWKDKGESTLRAQQYMRAFRILETGDIVKGGFFGGPEIEGLELPKDVLEKIYYKNAMRLYPQVKESFIKLGYEVNCTGQQYSKKWENVNYADDTLVSHRLDIYLPEVSKPHYPAVILVYGSAFFGNNMKQDAYKALGAPLLNSGFAVVAVNHQSSRDAIFPAQIQDLKAAVRFIRAKGCNFQIDTSFIGITGYSSGGHLSAMMGTSGSIGQMIINSKTAQIEGQIGNYTAYNSSVNAVVDWFGPTDFQSMDSCGSSMIHDAPDSPESILIGAPIQDNDDLCALANPISYIDTDDPPFLILHGDADPLVPYCQSEMLFQGLQAMGVSSKFVLVPQATHGPGLFEEEYFRMMNNFFLQELGEAEKFKK